MNVVFPSAWPGGFAWTIPLNLESHQPRRANKARLCPVEQQLPFVHLPPVFIKEDQNPIKHVNTCTVSTMWSKLAELPTLTHRPTDPWEG